MMRHGLLCDKLDDITHSYDYGIVPGSASVFVKDELNNIGKLDLTLLEGVMIVVEVSEEGYKVASCSPLSNSGTAITTSQIVQKNLEIPFETMDNLLMAVSPMFRERFQEALYNKLEIVHKTTSSSSSSSFAPITPVSFSSSPPFPSSSSNILLNSPSSIFLQQQQKQPSSILLQNSHTHHQQSPQSQQQQEELEDLNHALLSQEILDDLHNWIQ